MWEGVRVHVWAIVCECMCVSGCVHECMCVSVGVCERLRVSRNKMNEANEHSMGAKVG